MGARSSRERAAVVVAAAAAATAATVKVVLPDGELREYAHQVTAAAALGQDAARFFVCDADEMEFDALLTALSPDDGLCPGQLYFVLPRSMLRRPLHADDLAALVGKASKALARDKGGAAAPLVFAEGPKASPRTRGEKRRRPNGSGGGGGGKRRFAPELCAIPE